LLHDGIENRIYIRTWSILSPGLDPEIYHSPYGQGLEVPLTPPSVLQMCINCGTLYCMERFC